MDYAQVTTQAGFNIKQSSNINVVENAHLKGSIINAGGDKAKHKLTTGTLTTENIENHSDIEVSTVSAGVSTDSTKMASYAIGSALSLLGNKSEHDRSTTESAISQNMQIQIRDEKGQQDKTGKTAEETLSSLNRNTANANNQLNKQDLTQIQERQEAAAIVADIGAERVGDLAKQMHWQEGSPEKIALHGLIGYLSGKVGGGNSTAGALSAMGSEYINTEIANYLKEQTALTPEQRNAIQQLSAAGIGAVIGASLGGDSNTLNQAAEMALKTEKFNRQLHPDEMEWIKANAEKFAQEQGISQAEAEKRLIVQAAQEVDFFWEKMIDKRDLAASRFLQTASGFANDIPLTKPITFVNIEGKQQSLFSASERERKATGLYSDKLSEYDKNNAQKFTHAVQPKIVNNVVVKSTVDGIDTLTKSAAYALDHPDKVIKNGIASTMECLKTGECITETWNRFDSASGQLLRKGYKQSDIDYLYGKNMTTEVNLVQGASVGGVVLEVMPIGKAVHGLSYTGKVAVDIISDPNLRILDAKDIGKIITSDEALKHDITKALPDKYSYLSDTEVKGPNGGIYTLIGQDLDGNLVYQGKSGNYVSFECGKNKLVVGYKQRPEAESNKLHHRSYFRNGILEKIYSNYEKLPNGDYFDMKAQKVIKGPVDIGHIYGWEQRRLELSAKEVGLSQSSLNDYINARPHLFKLENRSENRSHKNEMPGSDDLEKIIKDMKAFKEGNQ